MKISTERLRQIIQEEVANYRKLQEKLDAKEKAKKKALKAKGKGRTDEEDEELEDLNHQ